MTDTDNPTSRSWFTRDFEDGVDERAALASSAEQALVSTAQQYQQATEAVQTLLDEHTLHSASGEQSEPGTDGS